MLRGRGRGGVGEQSCSVLSVLFEADWRLVELLGFDRDVGSVGTDDGDDDDEIESFAPLKDDDDDDDDDDDADDEGELDILLFDELKDFTK